MFYLLKDNRIIDTNDQTFKAEYTSVNGITHYSIETPNETHIHYTFGGGKYINNIYTFNSTEIKKQSEDVFDFIDWNKDLVRIDTDIASLMLECRIAKSDFNDGYYDFEWITAIYKLNEKGDYIKVWEKKNMKDVENIIKAIEAYGNEI